MKYQRFLLDHQYNVYHLQLASPPDNRMDELFFTELSDIIGFLKSQTKTRGLIISSTGRHFSSGADPSQLIEIMGKNTIDEQDKAKTHSLDLFNSIKKMQYPVVAAIKGCCLGSGMELALACHHRIASKTALIGLPETEFGLMPGCGGTINLPPLAGMAKSIELIFSSANLLAEDGYNAGIIDMIVDKKDLLQVARKVIASHYPDIQNLNTTQHQHTFF